jgi:hypothetical protein
MVAIAGRHGDRDLAVPQRVGHLSSVHTPRMGLKLAARTVRRSGAPDLAEDQPVGGRLPLNCSAL